MLKANTISSKYADFSVGLQFSDLERNIVNQAKLLILDLIGVSFAGLKLMEFPKLVVDYMVESGGEPEATILTTKRKFPAVNAVFANTTCAHALDMDDGHRFGALHPGTVVIPTAITAAELAKANTKELITGIVVGYEVMIRIGMAIAPSSLRRGFHLTGIAGSFGSAATAANIMKLNTEEAVGAFGMAGLQSSGLIQVNHEIEGAKVKPINPAKAAQAGLLSCIFAQKGMRGPERIFEGEDGFLKAVADDVNHDLLFKNLGSEYEINNVYIKLYSACRHAHAPIDSTLKAFEISGISLSEIREIRIETYPAAVRLAGIVRPTTPSAGRFSIPFSVALVLVKGDAGADKYSEKNIIDQEIIALSDKVRLSASKKWEALYPKKRGSTTTIISKDGRSWVAEVDLAKGEPENPANFEEVFNKFRTNAGNMLSSKETEKLGEMIMDLENVPIGSFLNGL